MKIIGLFAKANQGKTTTLNQVIERLEEKGGEVIEKIEEQRAKGDSDLRVSIKYKEKLICIATGGDPGKGVPNNCAFFKKHNPDIAISATRTKGATCAELTKFAKEQNAKIIWIGKNSSGAMQDEKIQTELNKIDTYLVLKHILDDNSVEVSQSFKFKIS